MYFGHVEVPLFLRLPACRMESEGPMLVDVCLQEVSIRIVPCFRASGLQALDHYIACVH